MEIKYGLDDVNIVPSGSLINFNSRSEITEHFNGRIWVAPMDSILSLENLETFSKKRLGVPLVRGMWKHIDPETFNTDLYATFSLAEAKEMLIEGSEVNEWIENVYDEYNFINILIDIANGHLNDLHLTASLIKEKYACSIMIGNIANPRIIEDSFNLYGDIIDYYRVGIGGGSRCHTSSKTAIHYPIISLLQELDEVRYKLDLRCKFIADGGIRNSSDIAKLFAAGADGVMLGSVFAKTLESASRKYEKNVHRTTEMSEREMLYSLNIKRLYGEYRGMSTIDRQKTEGKQDADYEEGFSEDVLIEYTLDGLMNEINKSLKSTFSYCNSKTLKEFRNKSKLIITLNNNHNTL